MMMIIRKKIVMIRAFVLGSLNIDQVLSLDHIVKESETLSVSECKLFLGGKGANQAVAVALSGAETFLVANVGIYDVERLIKQLTEYHVTPRLSADELTGQAIIQVDSNGENAILLIPNANKTWDLNQVYPKLTDIQKNDYVILQNEVSLDVIQKVLERLKDLNLTVVLNPAPFTRDVLSIIDYVDLLVLNRIEAEQLLSSVGLLSSSPKE
jgi:ribokinase